MRTNIRELCCTRLKASPKGEQFKCLNRDSVLRNPQALPVGRFPPQQKRVIACVSAPVKSAAAFLAKPRKVAMFNSPFYAAAGDQKLTCRHWRERDHPRSQPLRWPGRDACRYGPEWLRQKHSGQGDCRTPRLQGDERRGAYGWRKSLRVGGGRARPQRPFSRFPISE